MNYIQMLLGRAEVQCERIANNNDFFTALEAGHLDEMRWVWQLLYYSDKFTRSLSLRSALCEHELFKSTFARHDFEEVRHREQLKQWMEKAGYDVCVLETNPVIPTAATRDCGEFYWYIAAYGDPDTQVLALNVLSEDMALRTFSAIIKRIGTARLSGPFWQTHKEVDERHKIMGVRLIKEMTKSRYDWLVSLIDQGAEHYDSMLASWALIGAD